MTLGSMPAATKDADVTADATHFVVHLPPWHERLLSIGNETLECGMVGNLGHLRGRVGGADVWRTLLLGERVDGKNAQYGKH
jgi:hypothetical protein